MKPRAKPEEIHRACPKGATRGVDVQRMYPEISAIVRAEFKGPDLGVEVDDLVQETALAILRKNASDKSAFDPARGGFSNYVVVVSRSALSHMREKTRSDRLEFHDPDAIADAVDALALLRDGARAPGELAPRTVGNVVALLHDAADLARGRAADPYFMGFRDAARAAGDMLSSAFDGTATTTTKKPGGERKAARELADRVVTLLAFAGRPVSSEDLARAAGASSRRLARAINDLGARVVTIQESPGRPALYALAG